MVNLLRKIGEWLDYRWKRFRHVIYDEDGDPYLVRYRLIWTPWAKLYLHHILRSDGDRHLHDHPFDFWSLIIWNGYWEVIPDREFGTWSKMRLAIWLVRKKAEELHRLELFGNKPTWTLVWAGRKRRDWGFKTEDGWIHWQCYQQWKQDKYDQRYS